MNQAPEDATTVYMRPTASQQRKAKKENEALLLERFLARAGPVVESLVEEVEQTASINSKEQA